MNLPKKLTSIATGTVMAAAVIAFPASASTKAPQEKTTEVKIAGYDLSNLNDAQVVFEKIQAASNKVCSVSGGTLVSRQAFQEKQACKEQAVKDAVEALNSKTVSAVMDANTN